MTELPLSTSGFPNIVHKTRKLTERDCRRLHREELEYRRDVSYPHGYELDNGRDPVLALSTSDIIILDTY